MCIKRKACPKGISLALTCGDKIHSAMNRPTPPTQSNKLWGEGQRDWLPNAAPIPQAPTHILRFKQHGNTTGDLQQQVPQVLLQALQKSFRLLHRPGLVMTVEIGGRNQKNVFPKEQMLGPIQIATKEELVFLHVTRLANMSSVMLAAMFFWHAPRTVSNQHLLLSMQALSLETANPKPKAHQPASRKTNTSALLSPTLCLICNRNIQLGPLR